ncbi:MAG TPA: hypothetical protein VG984_01585 [Candidatus Paceibacterota bacterium]|nr:hypothetical protein [Candidatus Paceibacterota bacterium]
MSFPSALLRLKAGDTPDTALAYAMRTDTKLGYAAIMAAAAATASTDCPCCTVRNALPPEHRHDVLRHERRGRGVMVDINPDSVVGKQVARLLGTDAARPLMVAEAGMALGFANCCRILASPDKEDVQVSVEDQVRWQINIDC